MKRQNNKYSFDGSSFEAVVAHYGVGKISTARVAEKGRYTGINFIDLTELPTGTSIGIHTHGRNDEEIYVVISGSGLMTADGQKFSVGPGDVIVNTAEGTHGLENTGDEPLRIVVVDVPAISLN